MINNTKTTNRRINWIIGLEYRTTSNQLMIIKKDIENFIKNSELFSTKGDTFVSVKIEQFAASSIDIRLICFTKTKNYLEWMEVKDTLAFEIKTIVEKNKASFAFPSTQFMWRNNDNYLRCRLGNFKILFLYSNCICNFKLVGEL